MHKIFKKLFVTIFGKVAIDEEIQFAQKANYVKKEPWVSFIIPARNEEKSIEKCLRAIAADKYPKTQIIVINDLSTDKTIDVIKKFKKEHTNIDVVLIDNKHRGGPSPNRNKGAKIAKGEFIIMFDAHSIIVSHNFVRNLLCYFADKTVGAVAGARSWTPKKYQDKVLYYAGGLRPWREMGFSFLDNPNAAYRRSVFDEMGGIDTNIVWGSDLSSTFKVLSLGYKIPVADDVKIRVDHSATPNRNIDLVRKPFLYGTNIPYILEFYKWLLRRKVDVRIVIGGLINLGSLFLFFLNVSLWWLPLLTVLFARLHSLAFAAYSKAPLKYILGIPIVLTISEISYAIGFLYGVLRRLLGLTSFSYKKRKIFS